jgi:hypothetical protein
LYRIIPRDKLLKEFPEDVDQGKWLDFEQWFVLTPIHRGSRPCSSMAKICPGDLDRVG